MPKSDLPSPLINQALISQPSRALRTVEVLVRLLRPHIRRSLAPDEPNTDVPVLDLLHLLQRHLTVRATTNDVGRREVFLVDLTEMGFEALDALKQLTAAEGAISMANVTAELVVLLSAVVVRTFDDDQAVCEGRGADIAFARGAGIAVASLLLLRCAVSRRAADASGGSNGDGGETLHCMSGTVRRNLCTAGSFADVLYAASYADLGLTGNEIDLAFAADDLVGFLLWHNAVGTTLQCGWDACLVVVDLAEVSLETTYASVQGAVGPRAVALADVTAELDEGAVFELDDGGACSEELNSTVVGGPGALLLRRPALARKGRGKGVVFGIVGWIGCAIFFNGCVCRLSNGSRLRMVFDDLVGLFCTFFGMDDLLLRVSFQIRLFDSCGRFPFNGSRSCAVLCAPLSLLCTLADL